MSDLESEEYRRYGRQMILPEIGKLGQVALKAASVLIVGAGGLGCPAVAYLAGAGIGRLGIVDGDTVSLSNCHRQILYSASQGNTSKVHAAAAFVTSLNPHVQVVPFAEHLTPFNVEGIFRQFSVVLDCTDNQTTRYLISDACVLLGIPLVSGSALKTEGQLAIYNYLGGPCYRCIFPEPTPEELIESCGDAGILGPVVGVIGVLQALETIKLITRDARESKQQDADKTRFVCTLTLFSAFGEVPWRTIKLRKKATNCQVCRKDSSMSFEVIKQGVKSNIQQMNSIQESDGSRRLEPSDLAAFEGLILDVRNDTQFDITSLPQSINVPMDSIQDFTMPEDVSNVLVVCRNGVDSKAVNHILSKANPDVAISDLRGGLAAYARFNDQFPFY